MKVLQDPRPDLAYDSEDWTVLLTGLQVIDPMCAGVLHGFRCGGLRLHRGQQGYALRPDFDPATSIWRDQAAYNADRDRWLVPHRKRIVEALRTLQGGRLSA